MSTEMTYTTTEYKLCKPQKKPLLTKTNDHILKQQTKINDNCTKKKGDTVEDGYP